MTTAQFHSDRRVHSKYEDNTLYTECERLNLFYYPERSIGYSINGKPGGPLEFNPQVSLEYAFSYAVRGHFDRAFAALNHYRDVFGDVIRFMRNNKNVLAKYKTHHIGTAIQNGLHVPSSLYPGPSEYRDEQVMDMVYHTFDKFYCL